MRIGQILFQNSPLYERKSQRLDASNLAAEHEVVVWIAESKIALPETIREDEVDVIHVYGPAVLPREPLRRLRVPYVASGVPAQSRLPWRSAQLPARRVVPFGDDPVPEAVDEAFFNVTRSANANKDRYRLGTLGRRRDIEKLYGATVSRIVRFRDDLDWQLWTDAPSPDQLAGLDLWIDPASDPDDLDGFAAEAVVAGVPVVAGRTPVNQERLAGGKAGLLVPPDDPNELAHAIVTALFKPEQTERRRAYARETRERFRPAHRARKLVEIYSHLVS